MAVHGGPRCYQYLGLPRIVTFEARGHRLVATGYCDQCASSYSLLICRPLQLFEMAGDLYYSQRSVRVRGLQLPQ